MKRIYNAVELWNDVISDRDFVCFSSATNFRSYFDLIMGKFTPDNLRITKFFSLFGDTFSF